MIEQQEIIAQQGSSSEQQGNEQEKWKKIQPPQKTIPLFMIDFNQCDGKKCTGRKMQRFGLLKAIRDKKVKFRGIVLSAHGKKEISKQDLPIAMKSGICVIDCSWKRIKQTQQFVFKNERILPYVIAGNPVNYGKPYQLSCSQALATALCALDYFPQAQYIMSKFGWADGFWGLNPNIHKYGQCAKLEDIKALSLQNQNTNWNKTNKNRNYDMPQSGSSSQSQGEINQKQEKQQQQKEIHEKLNHHQQNLKDKNQQLPQK